MDDLIRIAWFIGAVLGITLLYLGLRFVFKFLLKVVNSIENFNKQKNVWGGENYNAIEKRNEQKHV